MSVGQNVLSYTSYDGPGWIYWMSISVYRQLLDINTSSRHDSCFVTTMTALLWTWRTGHIPHTTTCLCLEHNLLHYLLQHHITQTTCKSYLSGCRKIYKTWSTCYFYPDRPGSVKQFNNVFYVFQNFRVPPAPVMLHFSLIRVITDSMFEQNTNI